MDPKTQGQALLSKLRKMQIASEQGQTLGRSSAASGSEAATMPGRYFEGDEDDDLQQIKHQLASTSRPAPITDSDAERVMRKTAAVEVAKEEEWFQNQWMFNSSNPTMQRWAQGVFPEYFSRREQVLEEQAQLQLAVAKMKLRGPRSREDLDLLYAIDSGVVDVSKNPIYALAGKPADLAAVRGLFNPRRNAILRAPWRRNNLFNPLAGFPAAGSDTFSNQVPMGPNSREGANLMAFGGDPL
jgi:hypothetical protein